MIDHNVVHDNSIGENHLMLLTLNKAFTIELILYNIISMDKRHLHFT